MPVCVVLDQTGLGLERVEEAGVGERGDGVEAGRGGTKRKGSTRKVGGIERGRASEDGEGDGRVPDDDDRVGEGLIEAARRGRH